MNFKKFFRQTSAALTIVACLLFAETGQAEIQIYEGIGIYTILNGENHNFAKKQAKLKAERDILEQIYLYVSSVSKSEISNLSKDEIITVAAGKMSVLDTKFFVSKENGSFVVTATITAEIDPDEIPEAVEREKKTRLQQN
ncbi:MAG: hypothetical protein IJ685_07970 [Selenomonadaceae bacterium]|nr:hypothetical protein [Selenomonadaceae bacterium]